MYKKIYFIAAIFFLVSCSSTEYKGNSGTDQGKKNTVKMKFDGTDYYKIYGVELPKEEKKAVPITSTTTKTGTKATTVTNKTDTKTAISTTNTTKTTATNNEYKKPNTNDTKDYLFPVKNPSIKKTYKEGTYSGIDFSVSKDSDIFAVAPGMVIFSGEKASLGKAIFVYHNNGYVSIYTNLEKLNFKKGDYINSSKDIIAKASATFGFEFRKRTEEGTIPLDPNKYLKKR